ncbi:MAG: hypothetical protein Q9219_005364 [cf. Caloplaca sp. 3 TL-2023]
MQCYTELTPPTAVTHSLSLPFLSASANNLIVAKTSLLQVFSLKSILADSNAATEASSELRRASNSLGSANAINGTLRVDKAPTTKLVLIAQYEVSGIITSLARIKILQSKSGGETLLVSLRDAKVSLVEWDPERYSISTISIHLYEREDVQGNPWEPDAADNVNYLSVDPRSRCAALKFGARQLAIIPFRQQGDDLVMDDYDPQIDGERLERRQSRAGGVDDEAVEDKTPHGASFVVSMLALDPTLLHPAHLAFLHEYREPTFGVLSSQVASSLSLNGRRDTLSYTVITLDLEQRASTALLSVNNLPGDMFRVIPLRLPIGGALLIGGNELIHVDQAGKTNGAAVNEFAKTSTSFPLADQSDLGFRLEGCLVEQLGNESSELLLILNTGELAIVGFKIDGRSISGLTVRRVTQQNGGSVLLAGPSTASLVGRGRMFVGSEDADSVMLGWSRRFDKLKRQRSSIDMGVDAELDISDAEEDIDDDDDLYASAKAEDKNKELITPSEVPDESDDYRFRIHDVLENFGPMRGVTLGKALSKSPDGLDPEIITTSGRGRAGALTTFRRGLNPHRLESHLMPDVAKFWTVDAKKDSDDDVQGNGTYLYVIVATQSEEELHSVVYSFASSSLEPVKETDFDSEAGTAVDFGTLRNGSRIIQVLPSEVRTFDADFGLAQIFPISDEGTESDPKVISASFADPYVLLILDDGSIMVLRADESGDLDEIEKGDRLERNGFKSGTLYEDSNDVFRLESDMELEDVVGNVLMFLLTVEGGLLIYRLSSLETWAYKADGLSFLPPFLTPEFWVRRTQAKEKLIEILVTELGDAVHKTPYLILRSASNDVIIYQPYQSPVSNKSDPILHQLKPMLAINDLSGYSTVILPGENPTFIIKSASSPPQLISIREQIGASCLRKWPGQSRFAYHDGAGHITVAQLPLESQYHSGLVTRKIAFGEDVHALDYHEPTATYVVGVSRMADFKLPDDETHPEWSSETTSFLPQVEQGTIKLLDRQTWSTIDEYRLDTAEVVMCIKSLSLEISESTHDRQTLVVVGTAIIRGEDLPALGRIYVFNVIPVVPEPDRPQTGYRLKLIAKEESKGAVTAVSEIGTQGFLLAAQGQKCLVRGLKEDGTLLPVAFMDMQCYTSVVKELKGTGLCILGDALKGVWFAGYYEDPYQLRLFGKSSPHLEVLAGDILPDGKQLYLVVTDADSNIHVLQFDPGHPKSLSGHLLLPHTTFHTASFPTSLTLLPSTLSSSSQQQQHQRHSLLLTSTTGSLSLLNSITPSTHRTLTALQAHLQSTLPHPLGANAKAWRYVDEGLAGLRGGIVDGMVVRRWMEGGRWRWWGEGEDGDGVRAAVREGLGGFL